MNLLVLHVGVDSSYYVTAHNTFIHDEEYSYSYVHVLIHMHLIKRVKTLKSINDIIIAINITFRPHKTFDGTWLTATTCAFIFFLIYCILCPQA